MNNLTGFVPYPTATVPLSTPTPHDAGVNQSHPTTAASRITEAIRFQSAHRLHLLQRNRQASFNQVGPYPREADIAIEWPRRVCYPLGRSNPSTNKMPNVFDKPFDNKPKTCIAPSIEHYEKEFRNVMKDVFNPSKRILKELDEIKEHPVVGVETGPVNDNLFCWTIVIEGPADTPYGGGIFFVDLLIPQSYPFSPPALTFRTRIFHPNVDCGSGAVAVDIISKVWKVTNTIRDVLVELVLLFYEYENGTLGADANMLYQSDPELFFKMAVDFTKLYA